MQLRIQLFPEFLIVFRLKVSEFDSQLSVTIFRRRRSHESGTEIYFRPTMNFKLCPFVFMGILNTSEL